MFESFACCALALTASYDNEIAHLATEEAQNNIERETKAESVVCIKQVSKLFQHKFLLGEVGKGVDVESSVQS